MKFLHFVSIRFYNLMHHLFKRSFLVKTRIKTRKHNIPSNYAVSILSNNCLAGCIYHDYHMMFQSPTINCSISFWDFPKFVLSLKDLLMLDVIEKKDDTFKYPLGIIKSENAEFVIHFNEISIELMVWLWVDFYLENGKRFKHPEVCSSEPIMFPFDLVLFSLREGCLSKTILFNGRYSLL